MATTFGSDFAGIDDIDDQWSFETDETKALQQGLGRRYICSQGGLWYDKSYGFNVKQLVAEIVDPTLAQRGIDAEGKKDERVLSLQSSITPGEGGSTIVDISGTGNTGAPFALTLGVSGTSVSLLNGGT